jgi:AcrR family transcriptional regulator
VRNRILMAMPSLPPAPAELTPQQRRTRRAIVDAAARLLERDRWPSVGEVAAEAEVSRRTVYLYFATLEHLLADAALGQATSQSVEAAVASLDGITDVTERVARTVEAIQRSSLQTERHGRTILRLGTPPRARADGVPPRGHRRVDWLERALAPARERLAPERFARLVSELTLLTGWEAAIVLRDIRGLDPDEVVATSVAAARTLVDAALG